MNEYGFSNCLVLLIGFPGVGKQTVGRTLACHPNFRLVDHHGYYDFFLKLFGDDGSVMKELNTAAWDKLTAIEDVVFSTIAEVCPASNSYVMTQMMLDQDSNHQKLYEAVLAVAEKR